MLEVLLGFAVAFSSRPSLTPCEKGFVPTCEQAKGFGLCGSATKACDQACVNGVMKTCNATCSLSAEATSGHLDPHATPSDYGKRLPQPATEAICSACAAQPDLSCCHDHPHEGNDRRHLDADCADALRPGPGPHPVVHCSSTLQPHDITSASDPRLHCFKVIHAATVMHFLSSPYDDPCNWKQEKINVSSYDPNVQHSWPAWESTNGSCEDDEYSSSTHYVVDGGALLLRRDDTKPKSKPGSPNCEEEANPGGCGGYVIARKPFKFYCTSDDQERGDQKCGLDGSGFRNGEIWRQFGPGSNLYEDRRPGIVVPGFFDLHVHSNQEDILAAYGKALLPWLKKYTIPAEDRSRDADGAHENAFHTMKAFVYNSLRAGRPPSAPDAPPLLVQTPERIVLCLYCRYDHAHGLHNRKRHGRRSAAALPRRGAGQHANHYWCANPLCLEPGLGPAAYILPPSRCRRHAGAEPIHAR